MTRRVRFTPLLGAGLFATASLVGSARPSHAADVPFANPLFIPGSSPAGHLGAAADVDGDGDLDLIAGPNPFNSALLWHENTAGDATAWVPHTFGSANVGSHGALVPADLDGDGDTDVLSVSDNAYGGSCFWYENTGGGGAWPSHGVGSGTLGVVDDVDGDGDLDVFVSAVGTLRWYENTTGNGVSWAIHTIASVGSTESLGAADVDGDGDADLVAGLGNDVLVWHENTAGNGSAWTAHIVAQLPSLLSLVVQVADVDGDGDLDVVSGAGDTSGNSHGVLRWHENVAGNGSVWNTRTVDTVEGYFLWDMEAADVDADGDLDVASLGNNGVADDISWFENTSGNGTAWVRHTIQPANPNNSYAIETADLDGDGDRDVISFSGLAAIYWNRNDTIHESACFVPTAPVAPTDTLAEGVAPADVDADGDTDLLVAMTDDDRLAWYENSAGDGSAWAPHTMATSLGLVMAVAPADVDGDGDTDAFSIGYYSGLRWHRNDAGNGSAWTGIPVGATGLALAAADVDGDGDMDAVASTNFFDAAVKWYENTAGNGSAWSLHTIFLSTTGGPAYGVAAADIDGDGDIDVATTTDPIGPSPAVLWFENTAGNGSAWTPRTVALLSARSLAAADVDGDGDQDLLAGGQWLENTNGNGTAWAPHAIAAPELAVAAADIDADGDMDVAHAGGGVTWSENLTGNGSAWLEHVLVGPGIPGQGVAIADLSGDGSRDVASSTGFVDVVWSRHQGGQFSLAGSDVSPGGAVGGDLVPMLRIVATHLGRAGDSDLELASLGLLFEEASGDPLTRAEANALIENLQVYRDANGNGSFDPGTDTLVLSLPDLVLANGVQVVTFTDGDPNLQVSLGTPRTYFVVAELTADAGGQSPNQFQVTHLGSGPSSSVAEDRNHDIPLRPACPANVTAAVGPITPVELLGFSVE